MLKSFKRNPFRNLSYIGIKIAPRFNPSFRVNTKLLTPQGEAPAEPMRRQLGRSLALPLFFNRLGIAKMFTGVVRRVPWTGFAHRECADILPMRALKVSLSDMF
jgi:hypothetical protein